MICEPASSRQALEDFADRTAGLRNAGIEEKLRFGKIKTAQVTKGAEGVAHATIGGAKHTGIRQHFDIEMLGVPVPYEAEFYLIQTSRHHMMLMMQVATEHLEAAQRDWNTLLGSLSFDET